ncbi:MAG: sigma factor, partial [Pseudomonadota bacterium]
MMTEKRRDNRPQSAALFDELLVIMVQQGDRSAMERLYMRWHIRLRRAALRYTGDSELARDLAQETWLGIWKG